jgi:predicted O-methyltransferase YrrM
VSDKGKRKRQAIPPDYPQGFGLEWQTRRSFRLAGHDFDISATFGDFLTAYEIKNPNRLFIYKTAALIQRYMNLLSERKPDTIVELGVFRGGSTALLQLLMQPARMLALELATERAELLDQFIEAEALAGSLRVEYGVDQADVDVVRKLTTEHLGEGRSVDLVVDDASHLLAPTRTAFETLFPRLRSGGSYIIEDFAVSQISAETFLGDALAGSDTAQRCLTHFLRISLQADRTPLLLLAIEAMLAAISAPGLVAKVIMDREWLRIIRGDEEIDASRPFDLRALAKDHFGLLQTSVSEALGSFLQ